MFTIAIKKVLLYYLHVFLGGSLAHGIVLEPAGIWCVRNVQDRNWQMLQIGVFFFFFKETIYRHTHVTYAQIVRWLPQALPASKM